MPVSSVSVNAARVKAPSFWGAAFGPYVAIWRDPLLLIRMVGREVAAKYTGSLAGLFWAVLTPLLMLAVFTFVFGTMFAPKAVKIDSATDLTAFAKFLFAGLVLHGFLAEVITRTPNVVLGNPNLVKKFVLPTELLPLAAVISAATTTAIGLLVLLVVHAATLGALPLTAVLAPLVLLPFLVLMAGIAWFLSAIGVFLRDIGHVTGLMATVLLFLGPVFYKIDTLPDNIRAVVYLNPLTVPIQGLRRVLLDGMPPDWSALGIYTVVAFVTAWIGFYIFARCKRVFADVI
ncbi:MAG: ABC transporter permease [Alphaproteobacteria bacterium]|jgi:lipopolysaccharide transport system permease protein|nr:ABC transporter permease [Alphaproteobacteria bacterium]